MSHASAHDADAPGRARRYDPDRRDRIIAAALEVIAVTGIAIMSRSRHGVR